MQIQLEFPQNDSKELDKTIFKFYTKGQMLNHSEETSVKKQN